jgi:hypothetical protein
MGRTSRPREDRRGRQQVEESDAEGLSSPRASMDHPAAPEVHHHQELFVRPHPQLSRGLPLVDPRDELASELTHDGWTGGIRDVDDQDPGVNVRTGSVRCRWREDGRDGSRGVEISARVRSVGPVPDVDEVVEDRRSRVHPTGHGIPIELEAGEVVVPDQREVRRGPGRSAARTDAGVRAGERGRQDRGEDDHREHQRAPLSPRGAAGRPGVRLRLSER